MYLLDQFREFLTSLNVFLGGVPLGWCVPLASRLLYKNFIIRNVDNDMKLSALLEKITW